MIVKIWAIKENEYSGITGALTNSTNYIEDERKTSVEIKELSDGCLLGADDISATLAYMENEDKVMKKYITGVNCDPDLAVEQFMEVKERNLSRIGKTIDDDNGTHAFHIVQSFEDDEKLTPDLVHQCGIELAKKLGYYQAVVCTHIPGNYTGSGKHYHNHILINSHSFDPKKQFGTIYKMKYHDCKETYRELRNMNDDIAREHDLSIIKEPDNHRKYSWFEWNLAKSGESWKEQVRFDIESTKAVSKNWDEFKRYMEGAGYIFREGKYVTYTAPDGKKVRDKTLGREYTKEILNAYWLEKNKIYEEILDEDKVKTSTRENYYSNPNYTSTKTGKPYAVKTHDAYGRKRSVIELSFMLAAVVIKNESDTYTPTNTDNKSPLYGNRDWKLQSMVDAVKTAREEDIESQAEITDKLNMVGKKGNNLRNQLNRYQEQLNKMERLGQAIEQYLAVKEICEAIYELPEGEAKETTLDDYKLELEQYKEAKAIMYKHKVTTDEQVDDFIKRYTTLQKNIEKTQEKITETNETYRKLKKLEYQNQLAQNEQFTYGPTYSREPKHIVLTKQQDITPPVK